MSKWIGHNAVPIAPEHVLKGHPDGCSSGYGPLENGVHVFDVQVDPYRRSTKALWPSAPPLWGLIDDEDNRVTDLHRGMHQPAIRPRQFAYFFGAKRLFVELNGFGCPFDD
jgi:hypothetical protein